MYSGFLHTVLVEQTVIPLCYTGVKEGRNTRSGSSLNDAVRPLKLFGMDRNAGVHIFSKNLGATQNSRYQTSNMK